MILENNNSGKIINVENAEKFSISNNKFVYELLHKNVYENPIEAVIREIFSNAVDASKTGCIKVEFPSEMNGYEFSIEDDGDGMNEKELSIYTTYGDSTKRNTNELIGGLGIGAKSPFGYTDQFIVSSAKDGKKITILCFLDEENAPNKSVISVEDSKEHGTKVSLKIKEADLSSFYYAAARVFLFSKVFPILDEDSKEAFNTYSMTSINKLLELREDAKGNMLRRDNRVMTTPVIVEMGGVYYKLNRTFFEDSQYEPIWNGYCRKSIVLHANIGDLDFNASRESLRETEKTKEKVFSLLYDFVENQIMEYIKAIKEESYFDATKHWMDFDDYYERKIIEGVLPEMTDAFQEATNTFFKYINEKNTYTYAYNTFNKTHKIGFIEFLKHISGLDNSKYKNLLIIGKTDRVPNSILEEALRKGYNEVLYTNNDYEVFRQKFNEVLSHEEAKSQFKVQKESSEKDIEMKEVFETYDGTSWKRKKIKYSYDEIKAHNAPVYLFSKERGITLNEEYVIKYIFAGEFYLLNEKLFKKFNLSIFRNYEDDLKDYFTTNQKNLNLLVNSIEGLDFKNLALVNLDKLKNNGLKKDILNLKKFKEEIAKQTKTYSNKILSIYCEWSKTKQNTIDLNEKYPLMYENMKAEASPEMLEIAFNTLYPKEAL